MRVRFAAPAIGRAPLTCEDEQTRAAHGAVDFTWEVRTMEMQASGDRRARIAFGILLIALGGIFLLGDQLRIDWRSIGWPILVIGSGIGLFVMALVIGRGPGAGMAVPAGIVTMTGVVLAVQNATGLWATWAYAWALVAPFGVGLGLVAYGLLTRQRDMVRGGTVPLVTGLALFLGFGAFFELFVGLSGLRIEGAETLFAGGLVVLGVVVLLAGFVRQGRST